MMERIVYACKTNGYLHPRYHAKQENRQVLDRAGFAAVKGAFGDVFLLAQACPAFLKRGKVAALQQAPAPLFLFRSVSSHVLITFHHGFHVAANAGTTRGALQNPVDIKLILPTL